MSVVTYQMRTGKEVRKVRDICFLVSLVLESKNERNHRKLKGALLTSAESASAPSGSEDEGGGGGGGAVGRGGGGGLSS